MATLQLWRPKIHIENAPLVGPGSLAELRLCLYSYTALLGTAWVGGRHVQCRAQRVASVRIILFWRSEIGSKAKKTLDESKNCCDVCVDRAYQTPAAQIQEGSQVGKRQLHHARLAKRHWTNCTGKSAGCIEGTILAKRRGSLRTPHGRPPGLAWKLAGEANEAAARGELGRVFAIAKKLKSGHDRPHRVIRDEDGVLLVDEEQVTARWRRHWAELLHGQETRWSELANVASEHAKQHTGRMDLLTLHDAQSALERRNARKATGPSGIPISVWQAGGESSARILMALLNTTRVLGRSAVGMRGGRVQELYKIKGDRNETKSHRGILVQDLPGAMHASFLKRDIDEHYMKFIHEAQCRCAKGRGMCMARHMVELAANFSKGRGKCWGRLYLDLSAAFDSILREFLIADSTFDVQLMRIALKALNISDEVCEQIVYEAITERNLIRRTGASAQLGDLVGDMHTATCFVSSNEMPDNDDQRHVPVTRNWITTTLADVTFVDDACFSFEADNPVSLVNSASTLLQIVDETCEAHGFPVNIRSSRLK